jgi:hypothetical protein
MTVSHSFSSTNFAGQTILVTIASVKNPPTTRPTSLASVITNLQVSASNITLFVVEQLTNAFGVTANTANKLQGAVVLRNQT